MPREVSWRDTRVIVAGSGAYGSLISFGFALNGTARTQPMWKWLTTARSRTWC